MEKVDKDFKDLYKNYIREEKENQEAFNKLLEKIEPVEENKDSENK